MVIGYFAYVISIFVQILVYLGNISVHNLNIGQLVNCIALVAYGLCNSVP